MAAPDTSNLTSSSQVFTTYTLPQIRAIHKSLHVQIDEKAGRLRTKVGNSYRELLGTADTIVRMRHDMNDVQDILNQMGGRCGRSAVGGKATGLVNFRGREDIEAEMESTARVKLLEACCLVVNKLLRDGGRQGDRMVLAAKVLVLGRLLITSFAKTDLQAEQHEEPLKTAKKSLGSLRRKLLRHVEKALVSLDSKAHREDMLQVLCAYSLASSSGAKDVLWHFLRIRGEAIALEFDTEGERDRCTTENVLKGLEIYTRTLLDVQMLVPAKLSDALAGLKKKPMLEDTSLKDLEGLRLDIYERWCGDEILYFTPFIRHDDLEGVQAKDMLTSWAKKGSEALLEGLKKTLQRMTEFKAIVELRTKVMQLWIQEGGKARGFDPSVMLDELRSAINARLLSVLDAKVSRLRLVGSEVAATLEAWKAGTSDRRHSLWDDEMLDMDISSSSQVTREILARLHGKNDTVSKACTSYESWFQLIDVVNEMVDRLRHQRWDNDIDEIEDEDTIETRQELLSKQDPQEIHDRLHASLEQAFKALDEQIGTLWLAHKDDADSGHMAMYLLRVLRSIRSRLPRLESTKSFGLSHVASLHEKIVLDVCAGPLEEFIPTVLSRERVTGRALWEGDPAMPTQPSPGTFKLLRNLVRSMSDAGLDLWSPVAVRTLKQTFGAQLCVAWRTTLETDGEKSDEAKVEPKEEPNEIEATQETTATDATEDKENDLLISWLFDILFLQWYFGSEDHPNEDLKKLVDEVSGKTNLSSEAREKMAKASREYWKRTTLLFGLLV